MPAILAAITAAAALIPELQTLLPIIENALAGNQPSAVDVAAVEAVTATLNAQALAAETAAGAPAPLA